MILGLAGAKRSGKNTVAKFIAEEFGQGYNIKEWSFAEDLKKSAAASLGFSGENPVEFCNSLKEKGKIVIIGDLPSVNENGFQGWKISGREFLQLYGTEAHREIFGDDFWIENLLKKIDKDYEDGDLPRLDIITDVRFPNESYAIRSSELAIEWNSGGGEVIRINRKEVENQGDTHASEIPLPNELINWEIDNNGTLEELRENTKETIEAILEYKIANKIPYA